MLIGSPSDTNRVGVRDQGAKSAAKSFGDLICIIDDDDDARGVLAGLLRDAGYQASAYPSAAEALSAMEAGAIPDLILLDLMMPGMNGWAFRVEQRSRPALRDIPVVVFSADASAYARAIDAQAYIRKPADFERLSLVIAQVMVARKREQLTQRIVEVERLRSIGMLVASVAHEINNPLTYLMGNLDLAEGTVETLRRAVPTLAANDTLFESLNSNLSASRDGADRVAFVVRLLSTFVRADKNDARSIDPVRAIEAAVRISLVQVQDRARLVCDLQAVSRVWANEARLAQVLLNLLINAAQAIPVGAPTENEVSIRTMMCDGRVVIEVKDTGAGIPAELAVRIFEPFFTTKAPGVGTGLGLSISKGIISEAGGTLGVSSELGKGSTFRIELPAHDPYVAPDVQQRHQPVRNMSLEPRRMLVVDDEAMISRLVKAALEGDVVEVIGEPSLALKRLADRSYDLVLCDLRMPAMNGMVFYGQLCAARPDMKRCFVLMTGAADDHELDVFLAANDVTVLRKPFSVTKLRQLVAELTASRVARA